jgi:UDP-2-acetamido-2,6-beta-L-arabino-hexul-4-ose reductase
VSLKIVITGADGFIGRNLRQHLAEREGFEVTGFVRGQPTGDLARAVAGADFVFHLAGVNRPVADDEFVSGNVGLTEALCESWRRAHEATGKGPCIVYASSTQASSDNPYGRSKRAAEEKLLELQAKAGCVVRIFRLPNVFGKWARPNYNSAVATFCHNVARDLPIEVHDANAPLNLVHVDDVVARFLALLEGAMGEEAYATVEPVYRTTVGEVADLVRRFHSSRDTLVTERVGSGLVRALYATYVSYLPPQRFAYAVPQHADPRGVFVEMLKTPDAGQFSFFTAHPGVTRGGHYHHAKTEKFLVIRGEARFRFRHVQSGEYHELHTSGAQPMVVETIPGWTHDVTNVGPDELVVMLWANEVFDRDRPDTYAAPLQAQ